MAGASPREFPILQELQTRLKRVIPNDEVSIQLAEGSVVKGKIQSTDAKNGILVIDLLNPVNILENSEVLLGRKINKAEREILKDVPYNSAVDTRGRANVVTSRSTEPSAGRFAPRCSSSESHPRGETPGHIAEGCKVLAYSDESGQYEDSTIISVDQKKQTCEVLIEKDQTLLKLPFVFISTRSSQLLNQQTSGRKCSEALMRSEENVVGSNGIAKEAATQDDVIQEEDCVTASSFSSCEGDRFYFLDEGRIKLLGEDGARKFFAIPTVRKGAMDEEILVLLGSLAAYEEDIQQLSRRSLRVLSDDRSYTITGMCKLEGLYNHYVDGDEDEEPVLCDGLIHILVDVQYKRFFFVPGSAMLPVGDRGQGQENYVNLLIKMLNIDGQRTFDVPLESTEILEELLSALYSVALVIHDETVVQSARSVNSDSAMSLLGDERPDPSSLIRALKPRVPRDSLDVAKTRLHTEEKGVSAGGARDDTITGQDVEMATEEGTGTQVV